MLPSVSAGSAALTKYAQAVAIAAPKAAPRDSDAAPRPEQEAARQNAERTPVRKPQQDTLARDARATVDALLNVLRSRVLAALTGLGIPDEIALKAADTATVQLATALAGESRHAVEIVHALLEQLQRGQDTSPDRLLQLVARGLTVIIDHQTGDVRVTPPRVDIAPRSAPSRSSTPQHLLDFTDYSAEKAAPVLQALGAVQSAANAAIAAAGSATLQPATASPGPSAVIVAPDAFVNSLITPLAAALASPPGTPFANVSAPDAALVVSRTLSQVVSTTLNNSMASPNAVPAGEIMAAIRQLQPVATPNASANAEPDARIVLSAGKVSVAFDTQNGAITVQVGNRVTAYAPASLPATATIAGSILPALDAASIPIRDISPRLPAGKILDRPSGVPFIPPEFDQPLAPGAPRPAGQIPASHPPIHNAAAAPRTMDETLRHLDPAVIRNATVLRNVGPMTGADLPTLTRIALDISAEVAPGAPVAINPPQIGKFGLPKPAPAQTENGPVMKQGYADASANLAPVVPAVHMRGQLPPEPVRKTTKKQQKRLAKGRYESPAMDNAFTRDTPTGHQGLVFSSVVFSV